MAETRPAGVAAASTGAGTDLSVLVRDVHLTYHVYEDRQRPTLRRVVARRFRPRPARQVHALRGVSFEVGHGEVVGLIGRNGSGKTTLLRVMAGLLPATAGEVYASSVPVLLGVGAALHPELSGRRNVFLGGTALGMSHAELERRCDEIVAFAGLEEFIDLPLRTYSSGMQARLHFAIASTVTPEILLIDEALAVGDAEFRRRSQGRIAELKEHAGTVFLVSHSMRSVREMCGRAIWLEQGRIVADGPVEEVVGAYEQATAEQS